MKSTEPSAWSDISLIAGREITTRVRTKSFLVTTVVTLIIVVGIVVGYALLSGDDDGPEPTAVAQTGVSSQVQKAIVDAGTDVGLRIDFHSSTDARTEASNGDADAALVKDGAGYRVFSENDTLDAPLDAALRRGISHAAIADALRAGGGDVNALTAPTVDFRTTTAPEAVDPNREDRMRTAIFGVMLLIMTVFGGGVTIATGVIEEKSSRIVEILLATVKPARLLWGKILGVGAVMIGSTLLTAVIGLVAAIATGLVTSFAVAGTVIAASTVWLFLGFLFYAVLYAGTGAMLSRQEELAGTTWPLSTAALGTFYAVLFGAGSPDSVLFQWLAWIPPFSAGIQPIRIADGSASVVEIVGSLAVMVVVCALAVAGAGRIYHRSVLQVGARVKWREALGLRSSRETSATETAA
ncbi:ABC transporter permease [Gordonia hydrophobica]|uniref:ABC transporter permease n=1 Tax=Gordonia hydrophobica TaxID=40516 RepID=A0ABZ2U4R0_9ACTN|nr:ABC transporter permease [Gordonia hydrophobica]MBM7368216.1 ABC-2 type transport system permease protein [Gordonia hydrophobica]